LKKLKITKMKKLMKMILYLYLMERICCNVWKYERNA
jgi:hypothetical protein